MFFNMYIIFMTAFALIGILFLVTLIVEIMMEKDSPPSVTVMKYSEDEKTINKIKLIYNNISNNEIVLIGENNDESEFLQVKIDEVQDFITKALFTNNEN